MTLTSFLKIALLVVGVALGGLGVVALVVGNPGVAPGWKEGEGKVIEKETEQASKVERTSVEAVAPGQTETATFALG